MIKKIAKWTGIILLLLIVAVTVVTASRQNLKYTAPYPDIKSSTDSAVIARGKHLIFSSAHCADCHSPLNADSLLALGQDVPLSGGHKFAVGIANIYSKNITPNKETGIGRYTDAEIARALRFGVGPNGNALFDFMPFHNMSDGDLAAVISYLRSQKPVHNEVPENTTTLLGKVVKAYMIKPVGPEGEVPKSVVPDTTAAYGKYLATNVANCKGCHTNRDMMTGAYIGEPFAGGLKFEEPGVPTLITPNLTTDSSSRIFKWSQEDFIRRFRMGKTIPYSHMPWNSFKHMNDDELIAIYKFLKGLKPAKNEDAQQLAKK